MPWTIFDTALGPCGLAWSDAGVTGLQLPEATVDLTIERLRARAPGAGDRATRKTTPAWIVRATGLVRAHLEGRPQDFAAIPVDLGDAAAFSQEVYHALRKVPPGTTVSYGDLAKAAGSPGGARAVGMAMAKNPVPVIVPCHRVLAAGGKPGGFSAPGGLATKEKILVLEGWRPEGQTSLFGGAFAATPMPDRGGLGYDGAEALRHLGGADRVLAGHLAKIGDFTLTLKSTEGTFAALAESIVYQQLNGKAAATIFGRVRDLFPRGVLDPRALLAMKEDDLRGAGLSRNKLAALRDLGERAARGEIPTLAQLGRMEDEAIVEKLTAVRGIGRWTVEMLLIFRLGRPDVLPVADYGIKKGFARIFHRGARKEELPTDADLTRRGERWRPFRSVASWYLWRAVDQG